jgi:hypothetical protein
VVLVVRVHGQVLHVFADAGGSSPLHGCRTRPLGVDSLVGEMPRYGENVKRRSPAVRSWSFVLAAAS